jgi:aryl-alcohol dehydrogenase-like predicted oxidoreductase
MKYRILGKTGFKVSEVGFGAWGIGGGMWGSVSAEESLKALHKAYALGVNFYDTAWVYGDQKTRDGQSEKLVGRFAKEVGRDKVYIASKVPPMNFTWPARPGVVASQVFPKNWIVGKVNDSLSRLNIDCLDLMQFHVWQDSFVEEDEWKNALQDLTKEGKVKFWGLSLNDYQPDNCKKTIETGLISSVQLIFNIFHQMPTAMFPFYKEHNVGVIARVPLDEGGLTGNINEETVFPPGDFRSGYFGGKRKSELVKRINELKGLLGDEAQDLSELALRYILSFDEVSTVIPGMRSEAHCLANAMICDGRKLSNRLLQELKKFTWERNFYS